MTNGSLMPAAAPLYKEDALGLAPRDVGEKPEPLRFDPSASPAEAAPEEGGETTVLVPGGGVFRKMSEVKPEAVEWVADGWIPNREITVLGGDGGVGKGLFTAQLAAYLTTGRTSELFPTARADTGNVLLLSGEDSIRAVLWQRLTAAGAALDKVQAATREELVESAGKVMNLRDEKLWAIIQSMNPALVVVDPIQSFLPPDVDMNNRQKMRGLLQGLQGKARQGGFAILLVTHSNKSTGAAGRNRLNGSGDLWDDARSVLMMGHEKNGDRVYLSHEKCSYGDRSKTVLFTVEPVEVEGIKTARLVFDETSERKDADFVREKPEKADGKADAVEAEILSILSQCPDGKMESVALRAAVMKRVGCGGSTYDHVRCGMRSIRSEKSGRRGKNYTVLKRDDPGEDTDPMCSADAS